MLIIAHNRFQAFAIHLCISAIIFIVLALIIVIVWYPGFLFKTDGGWAGIRLIASVDFIIGPTLTLIVYKVGKHGLKTDLVMIAIIQLVCLCAGTWIVYQEKPAAIIFMDGQFYAKSKEVMENYGISVNELLIYDDRIPAWIYVDIPDDKKKRSELLLSVLEKGPLYARQELFRSMKENLGRIVKQAIPRGELTQEIREGLTKNGLVYQYNARYGYGYIEIDKNTGKYINIH